MGSYKRRLIDLHTHILPVDDGAINLKESVEMIETAVKLGFEKIVLTPHYMEGTIMASSYQDNYQQFHLLKERISEKNLKVELFLANEVMLSDNTLKLLNDKKIITINNSKYILAEIPHNYKIPNLKEIIGNLNKANYQIILVHPERCLFFQEDEQRFQEYLDLDVLFQVNLTSLIGLYGNKVKKTAINMLKNNYVQFLATDLHRKEQYKYLNKGFKIVEKINKEAIDLYFYQNPLKVIKNLKIKR